MNFQTENHRYALVQDRELEALLVGHSINNHSILPLDGPVSPGYSLLTKLLLVAMRSISKRIGRTNVNIIWSTANLPFWIPTPSVSYVQSVTFPSSTELQRKFKAQRLHRLLSKSQFPCDWISRMHSFPSSHAIPPPLPSSNHPLSEPSTMTTRYPTLYKYQRPNREAYLSWRPWFPTRPYIPHYTPLQHWQSWHHAKKLGIHIIMLYSLNSPANCCHSISHRQSLPRYQPRTNLNIQCVSTNSRRRWTTVASYSTNLPGTAHAATGGSKICLRDFTYWKGLQTIVSLGRTRQVVGWSVYILLNSSHLRY